jgi:secreted trypsin-like serine protease
VRTLALRTRQLATLATLAVVGTAALSGAATGQAVAVPPPAPIVGGEPAALGEFPWMVRVTTCGGSMYTQQLVLTAAHCVGGQTGPHDGYYANLGMVSLSDPNRITIQSEYVYSSPDYIPDTNSADWALIRLERPVDVPTLPVASTTRYDNGMFTIAGWGATLGTGPTRQLLKAEVPFVSDAQCLDAYNLAPPQTEQRPLPAEQICAGYLEEGGVDSCQGDSGGPMFRRDNAGEWIQVGIVSWGHECALPGFPGVYTQTSFYSEEIAAAAAMLSD